MFIELDDELIEVIKNIKDNNSDEAHLIDRLFDAMYDGNQIIYASQKLLCEFINCKYFEKRNRQFVEQILSKYTDIYSTCSFAVTQRVVVYATGSKKKSEKDVFSITLEKTKGITTSILATENPNDYLFYMNIANFIDTLFQNPLVKINLQNCAYGGATAKDFLEAMCKNSSMILAIVDSDKKYDACDIGNTAQEVLSFEEDHKENIICTFLLNFIEKENLVPLDFYVPLYKDTYQKKLFNCISNFLDDYEFMRYYDIKEGIKLKQVNCNDAEWKKLYEPFIKLCKTNGLYIEEAVKDNSKVIKGIGNSLADEVIDVVLNPKSDVKISMKRKKIIEEIKSDILQHIPDYIMDEWMNLYKNILTFGCTLEFPHNSFVSGK